MNPTKNINHANKSDWRLDLVLDKFYSELEYDMTILFVKYLKKVDIDLGSFEAAELAEGYICKVMDVLE